MVRVRRAGADDAARDHVDRRMVRRLGAKRWKLLHRAAYVAVAAGVIHYYLLVKSDTRQPIAFAVALGVLLAYRVVAHYIDLRRELTAAQGRSCAPPKTAVAEEEEVLVGRAADRADLRGDARRQDVPRSCTPDGGPLPFEHDRRPVHQPRSSTIDGKRVNRSYTIASSPTRSAVRRDLGQARGGRLRLEAPARRRGARAARQGLRARRQVLLRRPRGRARRADRRRHRHHADDVGRAQPHRSRLGRRDVPRVRGQEAQGHRVRARARAPAGALPEPPRVRHADREPADRREAGRDWDGARGHIDKKLVEGFIPEPRTAR